MMGAEELVFLRQRVLELEAELKSEKESRADITHSLQKELDKEREAHLDLIAEAGFVSRRCEELAEAVRTIEMEILTSSLRVSFFSWKNGNYFSASNSGPFEMSLFSKVHFHFLKGRREGKIIF